MLHACDMCLMSLPACPLAQRYLMSLRGHVASVYQVAWSADSRLLVSGSSDSTLKVWDIKTGKLNMDLPGHADEVKKGDMLLSDSCVLIVFCLIASFLVCVGLCGGLESRWTKSGQWREG